MRILHILHQYIPEHVGGTELYARALAVAQRQAGHDVSIFCRHSGVGMRLETQAIDGLPVYRAVKGQMTPLRRFTSSLGDRFLADTLNHIVKETQPDVVHIHHLMGLPSSSVLPVSREPSLVATLHDYWWVCANAQSITDYSGRICKGPALWLNCARCGLARIGSDAAWPLAPLVMPLFAWRATLLKRVQDRVAAWIAPTGFVRDWYSAHGFSPGKIRIIGHGIEAPPRAILAEAARRQTIRNASRFAYVGGLSPQKGVHVLIDAFNQLPRHMQLTIVGDETAFPTYSANLQSLAVHPGIRFTGRLERSDVWGVLAHADALVVPSLYYETASLVVQEAHAIGIPVIAANHGALAERVTHEIDGLLVTPGDVASLRDTIWRLAHEPDLLARLRDGIRPVTTMEVHQEAIESLYKEVLEGTETHGAD